MPDRYAAAAAQLRASPKNWVVTGAAGFIGSHLVERLLSLGQTVRALDNFSTGFRENLARVQEIVGPDKWSRLKFVEGDQCDYAVCEAVCRNADIVLHQGALGSVPRSIQNPLASNHANIVGQLTLLQAAQECGVPRFVYASSSSVYGDNPALPKQEENTGKVLSPYALTKQVNESYARLFAELYGLQTIGLRYFNVFGPRQNPNGAYAAVVPKWIGLLLAGEQPVVYGDGETSRDFSPVENVVRANLLAGVADIENEPALVCNIALGGTISLNHLFGMIRDALRMRDVSVPFETPIYEPFRTGDIRHSLADISRARKLLGFEPAVSVADGIKTTVAAFLDDAI